LECAEEIAEKNGFNKIVVIEHSIKNVLVDNVPIKGKLDKLEFNGKSVNVVDYKTGDPDKSSDKLKGPNDKQPNGGDYWRQAVFYKILVDNKPGTDWVAASAEFDFIEPDKKKHYKKQKIAITPADITTVSEQIKSTWEKIQNREFYVGCGKEDCNWCNFVKSNKLAVALHEVEPEEE
jgi:DNA helicase-2/ATP-dependent DNA helicase PcrA